MRVLWMLVALLLASALVTPQEAYASDDDDSAYVNTCRVLGAFVAGAISLSITRSPGHAIVAGFAAADTMPESSAAMTSCVDYYKSFERYKEEPVDYDEFVRRFCGGNPFNCPGNWQFGQLDQWHDPRSCSSFVICGLGILMANQGKGVSINELVNAMQFVGHSVNYGYWAQDEWGFLVGMPLGSGGDAGNFWIY